MKKKGHIIFCGYTSATEVAIAELSDEIRKQGIVILSQKEVPPLKGITHLPLDYFNINNLRHKKVKLDECSVCVIFSEFKKGETSKIVDMHTVLTVYNIKKENPDVHVIAEIINRDNTTLINDLHCDDIIFKETIDLYLIVKCILHPNISPIIYDLLTVQGKQIKETSLNETGLSETEVVYRDVRVHGLEKDITFIGYLSGTDQIILSPKNDQPIRPEYRLLYIE